MTTTPTKPTKFLPQAPPPQSWKEALDRYCRQHACLQASLSHLLLAQHGTRRGQNSGSDSELHGDCYEEDEFEVPWALPTPSEIVTPHDYSKLDVVLLRTTDPSSLSSSTSTPRKVFNAARSLVGGIYATVKQWTTEEEDEYWHEPESVHDHSSSTEKTMVSLNQPMVHVSLTQECLSALLEHAATAVSSSSSSSSLAYRRPPWTLVARSEWASWARQATTTIISPPSSSAPHDPIDPRRSRSRESLSSNDIDWLLDVLVANRHARILYRSNDAGKPDVIVFSTITTTTPGKETKKTTAQEEAEQDSALQIPLALFDLQHSMKHIEAQLEQWTHQVHVCSQKALAYKQQKQPRLALSQLARRKLLQEHIDSQSRTLLQLERVYHSIDMAQSNQVLLSLLSESSSLLHQLSSSTSSSVQDIDEIQDSIQDSMEQVDDMHMALTTTATGSGSNYNAAWDDDDVLLAELASLTLADQDDPQGTLRHEPNEEDPPPSQSQSLAFQDTASHPVTTTTTSRRRPDLATTDTAVTSS